MVKKNMFIYTTGRTAQRRVIQRDYEIYSHIHYSYISLYAAENLALAQLFVIHDSKLV